MNIPYLLSIVTTTIEMTICLLCAGALWRLRKDCSDNSRWLLALGSLLSGLLATVALAVTILPHPADALPYLLNPWLGLVYLSMHIVMTLYPITVVHQDWLTPRHYFFLFLPVAVFALANLLFIGRWTPITVPEDVWENVLRPDVIVRLAALFVMVPYCLILFLLPHNSRQSSASFTWILLYSFGLSIICGVHIVLTISLQPALLILLPLLASLFYLFSLEYELGDRLRPGALSPEPVPPVLHPTVPTQEEVPPEFGLWTRICVVLDEEQAWRDPELSLPAMARRCGTNVTYLNRIIREETHSGFKDLINSKRIEGVIAQLRENPDIDIQTAFFNAGYRSRATAWRNFKDIIGITPTEYRQSMKKNL